MEVSIKHRVYGVRVLCLFLLLFLLSSSSFFFHCYIFRNGQGQTPPPPNGHALILVNAEIYGRSLSSFPGGDLEYLIGLTEMREQSHGFRSFVAEAPQLTILRQPNLVYGGKLLLPNAAAKILKAISQKRHDGFLFLNDGNLDNCLRKKKVRLTTPARWLSSPHWAKCMANSYPLQSPSKRHAKTTALICRCPVMLAYLDLGISRTA